MGSADLCRNPTIRRPATSVRPDPPGTHRGRPSLERFLGGAGACTAVLSMDALALMTPMLSDARQLTATVSMAALAMLLLAAAGRYRRRLHLGVLDDLPAVVARLIAATTVIATGVALHGDRSAVVTFLENCAMVVVLLIGGRVVTTRLIGWSRQCGRAMRRTVVVGGAAIAAELIDVLDGEPAYGLGVVGFVDDGPDRPAADLVPWLGQLSNMDSIVRDTGADTVLVAGGDGHECALVSALRTPACLGCDVFVVPRMHHLHVEPAPVDRIGSVAVVRILPANLTGPARAARRVVDAVIAGVLVAVLSPWAGARVLASRIRRRGIRAPVGLPELGKILRGRMGLVGPHPDEPDDADRFRARYECYRLRGRARPGLTGLAQVNSPRGYLSAHERARYDTRYIETWSPWLDVKIVASALSHLVAGRDQ
jgi:lipopolysaccharide/colanic/teichoic acid biosynthesis glycosyltransferase